HRSTLYLHDALPISVAAMADESRHYYAVQFHPEVTHTRKGTQMLERFVREICGCEARWEPGNIIADSIARIREQVGSDRVLLGRSEEHTSELQSREN